VFQATILAAGLEGEEQQHAVAQHRRLAAITEMIHTASLVHDDVLDAADTRRGGSAVHKLYSTKAAVMSGDFLLARASVALARLEMPTVTQEMAKSLEALVQGEIMQLQSTAEERLSLEYYLTKVRTTTPARHRRASPARLLRITHSASLTPPCLPLASRHSRTARPPR